MTPEARSTTGPTSATSRSPTRRTTPSEYRTHPPARLRRGKCIFYLLCAEKFAQDRCCDPLAPDHAGLRGRLPAPALAANLGYSLNWLRLRTVGRRAVCCGGGKKQASARTRRSHGIGSPLNLAADSVIEMQM